ncbi:hypothetical protein PSHT_10380, partial [Puccinia striiformis]
MITKQNRQRGDLIIKGFRSLSFKCNALSGITPAEEGAPVHTIDYKRSCRSTKVSTGNPSLSADIHLTRKIVIDGVSDCHISINSAIIWLEGSEFDIVQLPWIDERRVI